MSETTATKVSTRYLIANRCEGASGGWTYLRQQASIGANGQPCEFVWASLDKATRFPSRKAAITFGQRQVAWMAEAGHPDVVLRLFPASGGTMTDDVIRHRQEISQ